MRTLIAIATCRIALIAMFPSAAHAALVDIAGSSSQGRLVVRTANVTWGAGGTANLILANEVGGRNRTAVGFPNGGGALPAWPGEGFRGSNGAGVAANVAPFPGFNANIPGLGYMNVAKFPVPAGNTRSAAMRVYNNPTSAWSHGEWTSSVGVNWLGFAVNRWSADARASVYTPPADANTAKPGHGQSWVADPLYFTTTPDEFVMNGLEVLLEDVGLTIEDGFAGEARLHADFRLSKYDGAEWVTVLEADPFDLLATAGSVVIPAHTMLSIDYLVLEPGTDYRIEANIGSEVSGTLPEPASLVLAALGGVLALRRRAG